MPLALPIVDSQTPARTAPRQTALDRCLSPILWWLALGWLALAGMGMHLLGEAIAARAVANLEHVTLDETVGRFDRVALTYELDFLMLWPVFFLEGLAHWWSGGKQLRQNIWFAIFPFLRLGGRDHVDGRTMWLPILGWVEVNARLERVLDRKLSVPMIGVALLVLPVLFVEYWFAERIQHDVALGLATHLAGVFIWLAFAVEFIVLLSVVPRKWTYLRKHWLDLAIICLPLIAFLRVLRIGRVGRLLRLNQLLKVSRTAKAFRLRGLALRVWRAVLLLDLIDRIAHRDLEKKIASLRVQLADRELEAEELRTEIARLETKLAARKVQQQQCVAKPEVAA